MNENINFLNVEWRTAHIEILDKRLLIHLLDLFCRDILGESLVVEKLNDILNHLLDTVLVIQIPSFLWLGSLALHD